MMCRVRLEGNENVKLMPNEARLEIILKKYIKRALKFIVSP